MTKSIFSSSYVLPVGTLLLREGVSKDCWGGGKIELASSHKCGWQVLLSQGAESHLELSSTASEVRLRIWNIGLSLGG